jgi:hypothetical protein
MPIVGVETGGVASASPASRRRTKADAEDFLTGVINPDGRTRKSQG